jgi:hypothetical protein
MVTRSLCLLFLLALSASAQTPRIPPPESVNRNGLVGRWVGAGGMNRLGVTDLSGKWQNASIGGAPAFVASPRTAVSFSGTGQRLAVSHTAVGSFGTNSFSAMYWVRPNTLTGVAWTLIKRSSAGGAGVQFDRNGIAARVVLGDGSANVAEKTFSNALNTARYSHVACVVNRATQQLVLFYDGQQDSTASTASVGSVSNTEVLGIGAHSTFNGLYFTGELSDVRIYNRALSADEIKRIYRGLQ